MLTTGLRRIPLPDRTIFTLYDYRKRHATYRTDLDLQLSHATFPWYVTLFCQPFLGFTLFRVGPNSTLALLRDAVFIIRQAPKCLIPSRVRPSQIQAYKTPTGSRCGMITRSPTTPTATAHPSSTIPRHHSSWMAVFL